MSHRPMQERWTKLLEEPDEAGSDSEESPDLGAMSFEEFQMFLEDYSGEEEFLNYLRIVGAPWRHDRYTFHCLLSCFDVLDAASQADSGQLANKGMTAKTFFFDLIERTAWEWYQNHSE